MDKNDLENSETKRKIYTIEELKSYQNSELSSRWPKSLNPDCVNSYGQWDPVTNFSPESKDVKRLNINDGQIYKNDFGCEKAKDDISLRPERRKWNNGCQVTSNKRIDDNGHSGYKKSYQNIPNCGGGDFDRSRYQRTNRKSREESSTGKFVINKLEKSGRNNSNIDDRREDKPNYHRTDSSGNNINRNTYQRNDKPAWLTDGPSNCGETIELHGISETDVNMMNYKVNPTDSFNKNKNLENEDSSIVTSDINKILNLNENTTERNTQKKGSRFQEIFQKEAKNQTLADSGKANAESILKKLLTDKVTGSDVDELKKIAKPLPDGVLTLSEIERDINFSPEKHEIVEPIISFPYNSHNIQFAGLTNVATDNTKVVNWLSNLNTNIGLNSKDSEFNTQETLYDESVRCVNHPTCAPTHHNIYPVVSLPNYSAFVPPSQQNIAPNHNTTNNSFLSSPPGLSIKHETEQQKQMFQLISDNKKWSFNPSQQVPLQNINNFQSNQQFNNRNLNAIPSMARTQLNNHTEHDLANYKHQQIIREEFIQPNPIINKSANQIFHLPNNTYPINGHIYDTQRMLQQQLTSNNIAPPGLDATYMRSLTPQTYPQMHVPGGQTRPIVKTSGYSNENSAIATNNVPINNNIFDQKFNYLNLKHGNNIKPNYSNNPLSVAPNNVMPMANQNIVDNNHPMLNSRLNVGWMNSGNIQKPIATKPQIYPNQNPNQYSNMISSPNHPQHINRSIAIPQNNNIIANLFKSSADIPIQLPPVPRQAKYADQLETENC